MHISGNSWDDADVAGLRNTLREPPPYLTTGYAQNDYLILIILLYLLNPCFQF